MLEKKSFRALVDPLQLFADEEVWDRLIVRAGLGKIHEEEMKRFVSREMKYDEETGMISYQLDWTEVVAEPEGDGVTK